MRAVQLVCGFFFLEVCFVNPSYTKELCVVVSISGLFSHVNDCIKSLTMDISTSPTPEDDLFVCYPIRAWGFSSF